MHFLSLSKISGNIFFLLKSDTVISNLRLSLLCLFLPYCYGTILKVYNNFIYEVPTICQALYMHYFLHKILPSVF